MDLAIKKSLKSRRPITRKRHTPTVSTEESYLDPEIASTSPSTSPGVMVRAIFSRPRFVWIRSLAEPLRRTSMFSAGSPRSKTIQPASKDLSLERLKNSSGLPSEIVERTSVSKSGLPRKYGGSLLASLYLTNALFPAIVSRCSHERMQCDMTSVTYAR